jgi:hypothetical protein
VNRAGDTTAFGDRTSRGAFAFAMLAVLAILALTLTYPFNNDNALYAYMADLLLKGGLPYLGSWDQNFPGILLVHAPQILILGRSQLAFHIWDVLLQLVSAIYVYRIAERLGGKRSATLAAILSALYYACSDLAIDQAGYSNCPSGNLDRTYVRARYTFSTNVRALRDCLLDLVLFRERANPRKGGLGTDIVFFLRSALSNCDNTHRICNERRSA